MDDEELIREPAQTALELLGYQVDVVPDGEACIKAYAAARDEGKPYAPLIMDLTIPGGVGGKEAIQRLLEIDPDVRAIVSSGCSHGSELANHKQHGFCGMVGKPYKVEELAKEITAVMKGKGAWKARFQVSYCGTHAAARTQRFASETLNLKPHPFPAQQNIRSSPVRLGYERGVHSSSSSKCGEKRAQISSRSTPNGGPSLSGMK